LRWQQSNIQVKDKKIAKYIWKCIYSIKIQTTQPTIETARATEMPSKSVQNSIHIQNLITRDCSSAKILKASHKSHSTCWVFYLESGSEIEANNKLHMIENGNQMADSDHTPMTTLDLKDISRTMILSQLKINVGAISKLISFSFWFLLVWGLFRKRVSITFFTCFCTSILQKYYRF
jgi:hypothetical protein